MEGLVFLIPIIAVSIPIVAIVTGHRTKLAEMRLKMQGQADERVLSEMRDLRRQMAEMRDTTTKYDLSFDTALQRIESRVGNLEGRVSTLEQSAREAASTSATVHPL